MTYDQSEDVRAYFRNNPSKQQKLVAIELSGIQRVWCIMIMRSFDNHRSYGNTVTESLPSLS
jgi:hypothetical protein